MKWVKTGFGNLKSWLVRHKKAVRYTGYVIGALLVISVVAQLFYPTDRTLPGQRIGGVNMGFKKESDLKSHLTNTQKDMQITLQTAKGETAYAWQDLGINIDQDKTTQETLRYPVWQRFIPLSAAVKSLTQDNIVSTHVDEQKLNSIADKIAKENYVNPANASLTISGTTVIRNEQKPGAIYDTKTVAEQIKTTPYTKDIQVRLEHNTVPVAFKKEDIEAIAQKAEKIISTEFKIDVAGKVQTVPAADLASWLTFVETNDESHIGIGTNKDKIKEHLHARNKEVYKAPGQMTITTVNGVETARTADASGQSIDIDKSVNMLNDAIIKAEIAVVGAPIAKVPPKIKYQRSYTKSQVGMNALLNDIVKEEPDMAISLRALDGSGISASAKGTKQYMPASTYKLSTVYSVVKRIETGSMQWGENVNGRNVDQCVSDMIIHSDNPCGTVLGDKMSWQAITEDAHSIGMGGTNLARGFVSTTNDQVTFLTKLQSGTLMNPDHTAKILNLMKQQKYRSGIPSGVAGASVANKVGFIDGYLHDSAIVYSPGGTYALAIYSKSGTWARMAAATTKINGLMNQ